MILITLNKIRQHEPCRDGWEKLLRYKGRTQADDEPFPLTDVLDSNGLDDTLWCLRCLPEHGRLWRHYACDCAEDVAHLLTDERSRDAIRVARRHADGQVSDDELNAAEAAARAAAIAARPAGAAARSAARAAWYAAGAVRGAAGAAWDAAIAARDAAGAVRAKQATRLRAYLTTGERVMEGKE